MNRAEAEHILTPIILGFHAARNRAAELLEQSQSQGMTRERFHELARHEAELQQALDYLNARAKAWTQDGLFQAVDTGRGVVVWPNVMPGPDFRDRVVMAYEEGRKAAPNVEPLRVPA